MRRLFVLLTGLGVIVLFVESSAAHLANPYAFLSAVYSYKMVPPAAGLFLAAVLPFLQAMIAACLLLRIFLPATYTVAGLLFLMFGSAQASVLYRGLNISCGCFGVAANNPITVYSLATSIGFAAACLASSFFVRTSGKTDAIPAERLTGLSGVEPTGA